MENSTEFIKFSRNFCNKIIHTCNFLCKTSRYYYTANKTQVLIRALMIHEFTEFNENSPPFRKSSSVAGEIAITLD